MLLALPLLAIAAVTDARTRRIPNALTIGAIVVGLALAVARGELAAAALGVVAGGVPALLASLGRRMAIGGGDVKLLAACGAIAGAVEVLVLELVAVAVLRMLPARIQRPLAPVVLASAAFVLCLRLEH